MVIDRIKQAAAALEKNNFKVILAENAAEARDKVLALIQPGESVGHGGSVTLEQTGILAALKERGQKIIFSPVSAPLEEKLRIRRQSLLSDVFMASPNAVTSGGKLMFWDSIGNRAAGMFFGPKKVIAVAGVNKIVADEEAGWRRMKSICNPANVKRLKLSTPCAATGVCADCSSPERICNIRVILDKKPRLTEYFVVLAAEELGY
jgi:hypothetical protein